jgi:hypothetical protein
MTPLSADVARDVWRFDPHRLKWRNLMEGVSGESPSARFDQSLVSVGERIILFGGHDYNDGMCDGCGR